MALSLALLILPTLARAERGSCVPWSNIEIQIEGTSAPMWYSARCCAEDTPLEYFTAKESRDQFCPGGVRNKRIRFYGAGNSGCSGKIAICGPAASSSVPEAPKSSCPDPKKPGDEALGTRPEIEGLKIVLGQLEDDDDDDDETDEPSSQPKEKIAGPRMGPTTQLSWPLRRANGSIYRAGEGWGPRNPHRFHYGLDIGAPSGTKVLAAFEGKIARVRYKPGRRGAGPKCGNYIDVLHPNGYSTRYCHLSKVDVRKGQVVKAGQLIGRVGSTGNASGPHLHFEVHHNGHAIKPDPHYRKMRLPPAHYRAGRGKKRPGKRKRKRHALVAPNGNLRSRSLA